MPQYNPYNPLSRPTPPYSGPSGPMRQYNPPAPEYAAQYPQNGVAARLDQMERRSGELWTADSVRLANQILSTANRQAAELWQEAQGQVTASLTKAEEEAARLLRQASSEAAAKLATAEQEAADVRAAVMKLSAELGGVVSAYVTENLSGPASPATKPATKPTVRPKPMHGPQPTARPAATPAAEPAEAADATRPGLPEQPWQPGPAAAPAARPTAKPNARSRQYLAVRAMSIFTATLVLVAVGAGASEVALHGFKFFVFRSAGTGETAGTGLQENQGPGQPDAPGVHK
jgi:hypothetical protein